MMDNINTPNNISGNQLRSEKEYSRFAKKDKDTGIISSSFVNVLLVFLESTITLMLRFNPKLRQLAYPLAQEGVVVSIRTYLPHIQVFATFNHHGVLLDQELPEKKSIVDITVNAYSFQIISVFTNHNIESVEKLQIRGTTDKVVNFKAFLVQLGVGGVIDQLLRKIKKTENKPTPEDHTENLSKLKVKLSEQSLKIDGLTTQNARLITQLDEVKTKQKSTFIGFIIASLTAIASLLSHFFI